MALTRAMLKGMGLSEEQVSAIIEEHTNVTSMLKDQIKEYKESAEKLPAVEKELEDLKKDTSSSDWEKKYNDEHKAFEDYKTDVANKEKSENIKSAYRKLLLDQKVGEKHIDSILRVTDFSDMKLKDDGTLDGAEVLTETIKKDWSGFIVTEKDKGADVETPPGGHGSGNLRTGRAAELAKQRYESLYGAKVEKES